MSLRENQAAKKGRRLVNAAVPALIALGAAAPGVQAGDPTLCYAVSDGSSPDALVTINRTGSPVNLIGSTGTTNIEAITVSLDGNTVYATNQSGSTGQFGTLNTGTGAFTLIGNVGTGTGSLGSVVFSDIDGLADDPLTGAIYGAVRREAVSTDLDVLIQINPLTGQFVPDAFGPGLDYVIINTAVVSLSDVDDIAIDPLDGQMYGVANNAGGNDRLVEIDKATGAVTDVGPLRLADGTAVTDMEGFSFSNDGSFYGTTGSASTVTSQRNRFWNVDKNTGVVTLIAAFGIGSDYEGLGCLTAGSNVITGTVYDDLNANGVKNVGEPGQGGVTVQLYRDANNNGQVDVGETLANSVVTAADGTYRFEFAVTGDFVVAVLPATLPANTALTTDNVEVANFVTYYNTDSDNDFGFAEGADLQMTKIASPDPVSSGATLTYTLTVLNKGPGTSAGVVVNDPLLPGVTWVSTTPSQGSCSLPSGVVCELGSLANGASATVTITATAN